MEVAPESMQSPLYLLSPEASIDATGRQIPSPNPTDYYAAPWSTWMRAVAPGLHVSKIQKLAPAGSFTAVVSELRDRMAMLQTTAEDQVKTLRDDIATLRAAGAAAEERVKTLTDEVATLTAAVAAAEERVKTLTDEVTTTRAAAEEAQTLVDNMASDMDMEVERRDEEANEQDKTIEKLKERVEALEGRLSKAKNYIRHV